MQRSSWIEKSFDSPQTMEENDASEKQVAHVATKTAPCSNCREEVCVSDGKVHRCKGCNVAVYCDKQCQRANWHHHKRTCSTLRNHKIGMKTDTVTMKDFLGHDCGIAKDQILQTELNRLRLWFHVQNLSISKVIFDTFRSCCLASGISLRGFPLHRATFTAILRPQACPDDNPGAMLRLSQGMFDAVDKDEKEDPTLARIQKSLLAKGEVFAKEDAELAEREWNARDRFLGTVPFLFWYRRTPRIGGIPILEPPAREYLPLRSQLDADAQLERLYQSIRKLQEMINRGHVLGPLGADVLEDIDAKAKVGTMQKVDGGWVWVQMSDDDVRRFGYTDTVRI